MNKTSKSNPGSVFGKIIILSAIVGVAFGVLNLLIVKEGSNFLSILFFLLASIISAFAITKFIVESATKALVKKLTDDMAAIKDGDLTKLIMSKEMGALNGVATNLNVFRITSYNVCYTKLLRK